MLYSSLFIWIDDILVHAKSARSLLDALRCFFDRVRSHGLRLSAVKSCLFKKEAKCNGISHDPARLQALAAWPLPVTGWLRDTISDYGRAVKPLHDKLEVVLSTVGRTRRLAADVTLEWTDAERRLFEVVKELIAWSQPLAFPSDGTEICGFTDASETGWGLIVTQVTNWEADLSP
ncbi:hypothetical protein PHMEG_00021227 [Phytophthora megakarya]|uniref:Reverse transcriptase domain-containing protein n=1 Tax=Phytophthora megakarya TaxID=4795 RepID=A0A225VNN3_9STRA|nr:hypothetical protein PHMEG_00021227 [Phytophthora megakarya]